jgi:hypothetical protein
MNRTQQVDDVARLVRVDRDSPAISRMAEGCRGDDEIGVEQPTHGAARESGLVNQC